MEYLVGHRPRLIRLYRVVWILSLYTGSILNLTVVWNIADCMNALMAIPNLISLLLLSGVAVKETQKYLWSDRLDEEEETCVRP